MDVDRKRRWCDGREAGTILIMVIFMCILLSGTATFMLTRTRAEIRRQMGRRFLEAATQNAVGGLTIAMVHVNGSDYRDGKNWILYSCDRSEDDLPGRYIINDGTFSVRVNNLGKNAPNWYKLTSVGTAGNNITGEIRRVVVVRVREYDFFSSFNLYVENGYAVVDDPNQWFGDIHLNRYLRFRNRIPGVGAKFYGHVSACYEPKDYVEYGGKAEAYYKYTPTWGAKEIELPPVTSFDTLKQKAEDGATLSYKVPDAARVLVGANGISILPDGQGMNKLELHFDKEWDAAKGSYQVVTIHIWDKNNNLDSRTIEVPQDAVVFSQRRIDGLQGNIYGRLTVACQTGQVELSDDIWYVDDEDRHPFEYDQSRPEQPDNFTHNPDYNGKACLAVIAKLDVLLTSRNGDRDLVVMGAFAGGVGGADMDGGVRWLYTNEYGWNRIMRDLRIYGSMIADGYRDWGHFKGWTSGGNYAGGYNNSTFLYDPDLLTAPPPDFMEIERPRYAGWQFLRRGGEDE